LETLAYRSLLQVSQASLQHRDLAELFRDLSARLRPVLRFDFLTLILHDPRRNIMQCWPNIMQPLLRNTIVTSCCLPLTTAQLENLVERDHIRRVLEKSNGVVGGPNGAPARLGMKRTTLQSNMKKLGISR
jgi:transcriptional regulator of acetoin/glycerol metabolism